ncbi:Appr-1-p processing protein [Balamuthia mandrillaris]
MGQAWTCEPHVKDVDQDLAQVKLLFRDIDPNLRTAWLSYWTDKSNEAGLGSLKEEEQNVVLQNVQVMPVGDIFNLNTSKGDKDEHGDGLIHADAIVSPANSFGFMDGGIDMVYSKHFGWDMVERLQQVIKHEFDGELLVGQATIVETGDKRQAIKYLVSAPTMRVPDDVRETPNAYLAFRATLLAVREHNKQVSSGQKEGTPIGSILCCGLGTAIGRMPAETCALQMLRAYENVVLGKVFPHSSLAGFQHEHSDIIRSRPFPRASSSFGFPGRKKQTNKPQQQSAQRVEGKKEEEKEESEEEEETKEVSHNEESK